VCAEALESQMTGCVSVFVPHNCDSEEQKRKKKASHNLLFKTRTHRAVMSSPQMKSCHRTAWKIY